MIKKIRQENLPVKKNLTFLYLASLKKNLKWKITPLLSHPLRR